MKILLVTGTRPELIRLSVIIMKLHDLAQEGIIEFVHVYTNQNYDANLSTIFFDQLGLPDPEYYFSHEENKTFHQQACTQFDGVLIIERPDKVLVLGDTDSGLLLELAYNRYIPIYHMEAGNRSYDKSLPEELNRKIIDTFAKYNLPYTESSRQNLLQEDYDSEFIIKTGNPIWEVLLHYDFSIHNQDAIIKKYGLVSKHYALLSLHRSNNVDNPEKAKSIMAAINKITEKDIQIIFPMHPRTKDQFAKHGIEISKEVIVTDPLGFFEFVYLEKNAKYILSDSGTVPEEAALFGVQCIILRDKMERPELLEAGTCILAGTKTEDIIRAAKSLEWYKNIPVAPLDYIKTDVAETVIKILLGHV